MLKKLLFLAVSSAVVFSQNIEIEKNIWHLIGSKYDVNLSKLNLKNGDTIWTYENEVWYCYKKNYVVKKYKNIDFIKGGRGFWLYSNYDNSLNIDETKQKSLSLKPGWNLAAVGDDINVSSLKSENLPYIWSYKNKKWYFYSPKNISLNGIEKLTFLNRNDAVWIYANSSWKNSYVDIGGFKSFLNKGNFLKVEKKHSDDIENIWNISFKIDTDNLSDFNIGIKLIKEKTGAFGEIVFDGLSINSGKISIPKYIVISGQKSNEDSGETYFYNGYNPNGILSKSISLKDGLLTLKLGTIMKEQTIVDDAAFKAISNYHIKISSNKLSIKNSKNIILNNLTSYDYSFDGDGLEGYIEIK